MRNVSIKKGEVYEAYRPIDDLKERWFAIYINYGEVNRKGEHGMKTWKHRKD